MSWTEQDFEARRAAHRRGHSKPMHTRARQDVSRANVLVAENEAALEVGELFDGEMLVVSGTQIVSEPIPGGGGGGAVSANPGLDGDGSALDPLTIVRGTGENQTRHGNDAAYTDARVPLAHTHVQGDVTNLVSDLAGKAAAVHTHAQSDITNLVSDLADKAAAVHTHSASDIVSGTLSYLRSPNAIGYNASDFAVSTTPNTLCTINLPVAGTYLIDGLGVAQGASLASTRTLTFSATATNVVSAGLYGVRAASTGGVAATAPDTASPYEWILNIAAGSVASVVQPMGLIEVSAASVITVAVSANSLPGGESITIYRGAFMRASRVA